MDASTFTLLDDSLTVSLYPTARRLGTLVGYGDAVMATILKAFFLPFEFASYGLPALAYGNGYSLFIPMIKQLVLLPSIDSQVDECRAE